MSAQQLKLVVSSGGPFVTLLCASNHNCMITRCVHKSPRNFIASQTCSHGCRTLTFSVNIHLSNVEHHHVPRYFIKTKQGPFGLPQFFGYSRLLLFNSGIYVIFIIFIALQSLRLVCERSCFAISH